MFSKPQIEQQFDKFVVVRLNTRGSFPQQVPDPDGALDFRNEKFKNKALPFYVVVRVRGKTLTRIGTVEKPVLTEPELSQFLKATSQVR